LAFQSIERRIERSLFNRQGAAGDLVNAQQQAITMLWAERNSLQD
jgi:hypothetical protein